MSDSVARWLFDPAGLTPHGFCLLWEPGLIWLHALSDGATGIAYFAIPLVLSVVARRRRDLIFRPVFWLFASFILLCGVGHWLELMTLWVPAYGLEGIVKAAMAIVSVGTAVALWRLLPHALALPSTAQLRQAHEALSESESRYRISFEQSPVPSYTLTRQGLLTGVSRSWSALLGYTQEEVVGRHLSDFAAPDSDVWVAGDVSRLMADGELYDLECRFLSRSGNVIDARVSARIEHKEGKLWIVCVLLDVTARLKAEAALRASEERLHQARKMEAIGQLTGGIAHDFNNMLQAVAGNLELLNRRIETGRANEAGRFIEAARHSLDRAAGLTHRMLAFARRQALVPTPVEPDELVQGMEDLIRRTIGPAIQLQVNLHDGIWSVLCDANQLENVLLNLAINSRDAMPEGGSLTITTFDRVLAPADLSDQDGVEPGDFVEIAVTDTGFGMTPEIIAKAFEPFFTTKPIGQGTGLGLSQLYGFVCQSGGIVRLQSKAGQGTTVRLFLPRHERSDPKISTREDEIDATPTKSLQATAAFGTVLVVEDENCVRSLIVETLRELGCLVREAVDGTTALRILESDKAPNLLITDIGLPGLNGRQLAEAARKIYPSLPIVLMTGYAGTAMNEFDFVTGIEYLTKPFTLDDFMLRVSMLLKTEHRMHDGGARVIPVLASSQGSDPIADFSQAGTPLGEDSK